MHLCPLQFDIVDRAIDQYTMAGETVLDPFGGLMTTAYRAILKRRRAISFELSAPYFADGCTYCAAAEQKISLPTLFDLEAFEASKSKPGSQLHHDTRTRHSEHRARARGSHL